MAAFNLRHATDSMCFQDYAKAAGQQEAKSDASYRAKPRSGAALSYHARYCLEKAILEGIRRGEPLLDLETRRVEAEAIWDPAFTAGYLSGWER